MKKVLWLASWYPNAAEPFSGDFIKRQAEAVSIYQPLTVLFVGKYLTANHSDSSNARRSGQRIRINRRKYFILFLTGK